MLWVFIKHAVVLADHAAGHHQAVLLDQWRKRVTEPGLFTDGVLDLDGARVLPEHVGLEECCEHAVAHVGFSDDVIHIPLLCDLCEVLEHFICIAQG